jgi:hypothetical protein
MKLDILGVVDHAEVDQKPGLKKLAGLARWGRLVGVTQGAPILRSQLEKRRRPRKENAETCVLKAGATGYSFRTSDCLVGK